MIPFIPFFLLVSVLPFRAAATPLDRNRLAVNCTGSTYAENSVYQTNLNALLSSLTAKSSSSSSIYNNATIATSANRIYGLYVCRGDMFPADCQTCVQTAATEITDTGNCPHYRQAIIWYDACMLRYSDTNFFGVPDSYGFIMANGDQSITPLVPYQLVSDLVQVAPFRRPMFASNDSTSISTYGMAQCTDDLTSAGCIQCLNTILKRIKLRVFKSNGWRCSSASCSVRYEAYPFLQNFSYSQIVESTCSANNLLSSNKLNTLLSDVISKAGPTGFYNDTQSELFGLALCRADIPVPSDDCNNCLTQASTTLTTEYCPNNTQGTVWYEKCMVRYSNESFFGVVDYDGKSYCGVDQSGSDNVAFVTTLVGVAANNIMMFAANDTGVGSAQQGYALVQCSRDMSSEGCESCLKKGMSVVNRDCKQTNGWRYLSGSCTIRYEEFAFFNTSTIGVGAPQLAPQPLLPKARGGGKHKSSKMVAIILGPVLGAILLGTLLYLLCWILKRRNVKSPEPFGQPSNMDIPFVDLAIIQAATGDFSNANKLGEGGFGPVYKGTLSGGQEIAVKRLSTKSKQGASEFKNEMKLIAKLQHKNLVRVLGCCVEREEQLLIYEYLPNKSLDAFLFDENENKRTQLDWTRRRLIIAGIAKGLLYLHEDSLLRVIHRDLKASNVLLDNEMNPKISDFGMAKIFETDLTDVNNGRVLGTCGYMAPEYVIDGIFSEKSDVYSFGVLLLEIVSGQKNGQTFLRHAWQKWSQNRAMELIDVLLGDSYPQAEVIRVIHIALLCVQENVEERPTMSSVVLMLRTDQMVLPMPTQPPTFSRQRTLDSDLNSSMMTASSTKGDSIYEVTTTEPTPGKHFKST